MAVLGIEPVFKVYDSNGNPLVGGKVFTYVTGTTTNKKTYTDSTATIANPNPVILDSNGSADIWLDTDALYTFVIKDTDDTTLYTVNSLTGVGNISAAIVLNGNLNTNGNDIIDTTSITMTTPFVEIGDGSTAPGEIHLLEDSDNGTNYMGIKAPSAVTTSTELELPDGDGTNGQILTTNASGVLSWTAFTPGMTLLATATASASSEIKFDSGIDSTYTNYILCFDSVVPATDGVDLNLDLSTDGGSTWETGNLSGSGYRVNESGLLNYAYTAGGEWILTGNSDVGSGTGENTNGFVYLYNPAASDYTYGNSHCTQLDSAGNLEELVAAFALISSSAVDAVRFIMSSGNIASGNFYLYGLDKTV